MLKQALRYLGIGFFLSACLLLGLTYANLLVVQPTTTQVTTTTVQQNSSSTNKTETSQISSSSTVETTTTTQTTTTVGQEKRITVTENEDSHTIVDKLVTQGIISQAEPLLNYLMDKQLDTKLQNGTFTIPVGATIEQLAEILTTYPGN